MGLVIAALALSGCDWFKGVTGSTDTEMKNVEILPGTASDEMITLDSASGDGTVRVWDMSDPAAPKATATLRPGDGRTVYMARFSPDGTQLATSADDGSLTVYRVGTAVDPIGTLAAELAELARRFPGLKVTQPQPPYKPNPVLRGPLELHVTLH